MKIKEEIAEELKEYIKKFDNYDNELAEAIDKKEAEYQEKRKIFNEKWGEDIFPTDIIVRDNEEKELQNEENMLKEEKKKLADEVKESEKSLKSAIVVWENKIDSRRAELVKYVNSREEYLQQKEILEKKLQEQIKGIKLWEKNGINSNDVLYRKRKDVIIPNLEKQVKDIDLKLNEASIREEYKELGKLKKQLKEIKLHDRKHIIPELIDIFEIRNEKTEKVETEKIEPEEVETEKVETEKIEPEEVEPEKVESEKVETEKVEPEKVEPEKVETEEVELEEVEPEEVETEKVETEKIEPEEVEPEKVESEKVEPEKVETEEVEPEEVEPKQSEPVRLIIGRNIMLKDVEGKTDKICSVKEYFRHREKFEDRDSKSKQLKFLLDIDDKDPIVSNIEDLDSMIAFSLIRGINKKLLSKQDVLKAIEAISSKDKELLDSILPIQWDKNDLSKGAFLPWNKKNRDEVIKHADENSEITNVTGEYEPNPVKRFLKRAKQALPQRKKQEQITDGSERSYGAEEESKAERVEGKKKKLSEREDIKLSENYCKIVNDVSLVENKEDLKRIIDRYKEAKADEELSEKEEEALEQIIKKKALEVMGTKGMPVKQEEKDKEPTK